MSIELKKDLHNLESITLKASTTANYLSDLNVDKVYPGHFWKTEDDVIKLVKANQIIRLERNYHVNKLNNVNPLYVDQFDKLSQVSWIILDILYGFHRVVDGYRIDEFNVYGINWDKLTVNQILDQIMEIIDFYLNEGQSVRDYLEIRLPWIRWILASIDYRPKLDRKELIEYLTQNGKVKIKNIFEQLLSYKMIGYPEHYWTQKYFKSYRKYELLAPGMVFQIVKFDAILDCPSFLSRVARIHFTRI